MQVDDMEQADIWFSGEKIEQIAAGLPPHVLVNQIPNESCLTSKVSLEPGAATQ